MCESCIFCNLRALIIGWKREKISEQYYRIHETLISKLFYDRYTYVIMIDA